jgi:hypothetical protein
MKTLIYRNLCNVVFVFGLICLLTACQDGPEGLGQTPEGSGATILFDLDVKPLPEIPFPNDIATRPDATASTGRRINASLIAPTTLEAKIRQKLNQLDGFGTFQAVSVAFNQPLDIENIVTRQRDNLDFADDVIYLVSIDPDSPDYAKPVLLDFGRGNFPVTLKRSDSYFTADPRWYATNAIFETADEDQNGNGILDPGEDSDDDGVLDRPNVWPKDSDPLDGLMTFYENETNTLIARPVVPLRQSTTYAVILTNRLVGIDGQPVRSPFKWKHHLTQTEDLARLEDVFDKWQDSGISMSWEDVAFSWVYSTQSITEELVAIREGINGVGPLAWLADEFSTLVKPELAMDSSFAIREKVSPYTMQAWRLYDAFMEVGIAIMGDDFYKIAPMLETFEHLDYLVAGTFKSPDFLRTEEEDIHGENFDLDITAGTAQVVENEINFLLAVPKETEKFKQPFPVAIYCHGYGSFKVEALAFASLMSRFGIATVGIDGWGHGSPLNATAMSIVKAAGNKYGFSPYLETMFDGRERDLDGDDIPDPGGEFWTAYGFHTRDVVRQTVVDHFQLFRILRSWDGQNIWDLDQDEDGELDLAGDFNNDGVVDAGGPDVKYYAWGQSMGGIISALLAPLEPSVIAAAPTAGGAGMSDVGIRTQLLAVRNAVMLRTMGPLVVGLPTGADDAVQVSLVVPVAKESNRMVIDEVRGVYVGDRVLVENITKGEEHWSTIKPGFLFRVSMEADIADFFSVTFYDQQGREYAHLDSWSEDVSYYKDNVVTYGAGDPLQTPTEGFGLSRCTPSLRRMISLFQAIVDKADPVNFMPFCFMDPLDIRPEGKKPTNLLVVACLGDQDVPVHTQATMGRAGGVIPYLEEDPRYGMTPNDWLISKYVYEGVAGLGRYPDHMFEYDDPIAGPIYVDAIFDPDDLDENSDGFNAPAPSPANRLRTRIETESGVSAMRFAYLRPDGVHGIMPTNLSDDFNVFAYFANMLAHYFYYDGKVLIDNVLLQYVDSYCRQEGSQITCCTPQTDPACPRPGD